MNVLAQNFDPGVCEKIPGTVYNEELDQCCKNIYEPSTLIEGDIDADDFGNSFVEVNEDVDGSAMPTLTKDPSNTVHFEVPESVISEIKEKKPIKINLKLPFIKKQDLKLRLKYASPFAKNYKKVKPLPRQNIPI